MYSTVLVPLGDEKPVDTTAATSIAEEKYQEMN
jgi:hypothetical protein